MYRVIKGGECIGMTEAPVYIRLAENGCFNLCEKEEATGIAFEGSPYTLSGNPLMDGTESVMLEHVDAGTKLSDAETALADADAMNADQEYRLTLLELGITEEV